MIFFDFSHEILHVLNDDGTIKLRFADPGAYYKEIAKEIRRTFRNYSDVKIVCGDGSKFDANKSILSRCPSLSQYLQSDNQFGESKFLKVLLNAHANIIFSTLLQGHGLFCLRWTLKKWRRP